jgi:hypothetical protein
VDRKWIAADRDLRIGFGNLTELHINIALAHVRAHGFREHANADVELRRHLIEHRLHDRRHARHHDYIAEPEARRPRHTFENEIREREDWSPHVMTDAYRPFGGNKPTAAVAQSGDAEIGFAPAR